MNTAQMHWRLHAGFSLVQLLAVIAIIGVLGAIAMPAINGIRERVDDVRCRQNLRDLGVALGLHLSENEGRFMPRLRDEGGFGDVPVPNWGPTWAEYFTRKYFDYNKSFLHCPARPAHWSNAAGYYVDYAYNQRLPQEGPMGFQTIYRVQEPDRTIAFVESVRPNRATAVSGIYSIAAEVNVHYRHGKGSVAYVVYVDGRVDEGRIHPDIVPEDSDHPFNQSAFRHDL